MLSERWRAVTNDGDAVKERATSDASERGGCITFGYVVYACLFVIRCLRRFDVDIVYYVWR